MSGIWTGTLERDDEGRNATKNKMWIHFKLFVRLACLPAAAGCPFLLCIEDSDSIVKLIYKKIRGKEERNCCLGGGRWWSRIPLKCRSSTLDMVCWDEDDLRSSVIYKDEVMFSISKDV